MKKYGTIILSLIIAFVFLQSLPFKFSNSLETQHIFTTLGEWSGITLFGQYGGFLIGFAELVASILILLPIISLVLPFIKQVLNVPLFHALGALMAFGIMSGAIFFHVFTPLGIVMPLFDPATGVQNGTDGGTLFIMACITWVSSVILLAMHYQSRQSTASLAAN